MPIVALRAYILLRFAPGACFRRKNIKTENAIDFLGCVFFALYSAILILEQIFRLALVFSLLRQALGISF